MVWLENKMLKPSTTCSDWIEQVEVLLFSSLQLLTLSKIFTINIINFITQGYIISNKVYFRILEIYIAK